MNFMSISANVRIRLKRAIDILRLFCVVETLMKLEISEGITAFNYFQKISGVNCKFSTLVTSANTLENIILNLEGCKMLISVEMPDL